MPPDKKRGFREVDISIAGFQKGKDRHLQPELEAAPRPAKWRMNLTAFSLRRNLLFVAYGDVIQVFQPTFPSQRFGPKLFWWTVPSTSSSSSGAILATHPHYINQLVVAEYGDDEVLATVHDEGDVIVCTVESVCRAINAFRSGELQAPEAAEKYLRCIVKRNVGASAWGIAVHKEARLVAASSNRYEITIYAPALIYQKLPDLQLRTVDKELIFAGHHHNIPCIAFCNDGADPYGRWLVSTDIRGSIIIWDVWNGRGLRRINMRSHGLDLTFTLGWSVTLIAPQDFLEVKDYEELVGFAPESPPRPGDLLDVSRVRRHVRDSTIEYADGQEQQPRIRRQRTDPVIPALVPDQAMDSPELSISSEDDGEEDAILNELAAIRFNDNLERRFRDISATIRVDNPQSLPIDPITRFGRSYGAGIHRMESDDPRIQPMQPQMDLYTLPSHSLDFEPAHSASNILAPKKFSFNSPAMTPPVLKHLDPRIPFSILHAGADVVTLLQPPFNSTARFCVEPCLQDLPHHLLPLKDCDRLNFSVSIPALRVVVLGTQSGRAAVFSLTEKRYIGSEKTTYDYSPMNFSKDKCRTPQYAMRLDWLLPFTSQETRGERPGVPLMGIAAAPLQGHQGDLDHGILPESKDAGSSASSGSDDSRPKADKWRLLLMYLDNTVLSYNLWRGDEDGDELLFF